MANEQGNNPTTGAESDISKAQSQQQPPSQARQQKSQTGEREGQFETNQQGQQQPGEDQSGAAPDEGMQGDTLSQQRTDVEGGSLAAGESDEIAGGFVGSKGERDSSSRLVDDEDEDFARDGQGAPEGK